jgi:non-ribosomal peptide synthetase component F
LIDVEKSQGRALFTTAHLVALLEQELGFDRDDHNVPRLFHALRRSGQRYWGRRAHRAVREVSA